MRTRIEILLLAVLAIAGCAKEPDTVKDPEGIVLELYLEDTQTKATRIGDGTLNENVVSSALDIFFYDETTLEIRKEVLGAVRSGTLVQIQTNPNDLEGVFGTMAAGAHCGVFVVANFSGSYQGTPGSRTITQIKSSLLPAPDWELLPQTSFVMTGEQQVSLGNIKSSTPVYASIGLARVAAKVTFELTVTQNAQGEAESWEPDVRNMTVYMVNAMRKASLAASPEQMPATTAATYGAGETVLYAQYEDKLLYDTGTTRARARGNETVESPVYSTTHNGEMKPFYTYPVTWETGSSMEPYLKLIIPWTYGRTTRKYYYKIPFHGNALERNHWYNISIDVKILGVEQADPPEVDITYGIAAWSGEMDQSTAQNITSETSVPATVITTRFLTIPTTEFILYDHDELEIPIHSSHDVEIVGFNVDTDNAYKPAHQDDDTHYVGNSGVRLYNPYLSTLNLSEVAGVRPDYSTDPPTASVNAEGWSIAADGRNTVNVSHSLNRDLSGDDFDVAPYTLRFRVRHKSAPDQYYVDVTIEQRPAIIIQPQRNSDNGTPDGRGHTTEDGYVFINGVRTNTDMSTNRTNTNFNMYVVETSVLPSDGESGLSSYVLGDPRQWTPVSVTGGMSQEDYAQGVSIADGTTRRMMYYYPAAEDLQHSVFIAPAFRTASSFGTSSSLSRDNAVLRCATYQEDGYPAGRWRLPTRAEIEYMVSLSQKGKIPTLFSAESDVKYGGYWCSDGAVFPLSNGTIQHKDLDEAMSMTVYNSSGSTLGTGVHWARCVYDEWFWSDTLHEKAERTVWTWGDEERSTVRKK